MDRTQMGTRAKQKAPSMVMMRPLAGEAEKVAVSTLADCVRMACPLAGLSCGMPGLKRQGDISEPLPHGSGPRSKVGAGVVPAVEPPAHPRLRPGECSGRLAGGSATTSRRLPQAAHSASRSGICDHPDSLGARVRASVGSLRNRSAISAGSRFLVESATHPVEQDTVNRSAGRRSAPAGFSSSQEGGEGRIHGGGYLRPELRSQGLRSPSISRASSGVAASCPLASTIPRTCSTSWALLSASTPRRR